MKKKTVMLVAAIAMILCLAVGGTLAYFTDTTETATNTFTMGNVDITLDEAKVVAGDDGEYTATQERVTENTYNNLYPGQVLPKDPTVTNTGSQDAYVRVRVSFPVVSGNAQADFASVGSLIGNGAQDYVFGKLDTYNLPAVFGKLDLDKWTVEQTEYNMPFFGTPKNILTLTFTYNEVLAPEEKVVLFETVTLDPSIESAINVQMDITADAIQAAGFKTAADAFAAFDAE